MFAYAEPGNTCNEAVAQFSITLSELTSWNPVLGYPDGSYCGEKLWAEYDYCVGVDRADSGDTVSPSIGEPTEMIADKEYTKLSDDRPIEDFSVAERDCTDRSRELYSKCWQELNMDSWLAKWYEEEPQCEDGLQLRGCSGKKPDTNEDEAWTKTLNREYIGAGGSDCTALGGDCEHQLDPRGADEIPPLARARYRYVHYNIAAIHKYFNSWVKKVTEDLNNAGDLIPPIVQAIDQREAPKTNVKKNILLSVLSAGLLLVPAIGPVAGVSMLGITAANVGLNAIKASPAAARALFPQGRGDPPQQNTINLLTIQTIELIPNLTSNIEATLSVVQGEKQTNPSAFLAFASRGNFSIDQQDVALPDVDQISNPTDRISPLLIAYTTFIASTTLAQTEWFAILVPGADPRGITNGTTQHPDGRNNHDLQCNDYDDYGQCVGTYWWYSQEQNSAYVLNKGKEENSTGLLSLILSSGWSTGKLLFENAAVCTIQNFLRNIETIDNSTVTYTINNGTAGFQFSGPLPELEREDYDVLDQANQTYFMPFAGSGLTRLRQLDKYRDSFRRPVDAEVWNVDNAGIDFSCISQINVSIATV
ncbi:MAG: hypothetical protein Q9183_002395 [Haloplaca sp. 2 TL-2023]